MKRTVTFVFLFACVATESIHGKRFEFIEDELRNSEGGNQTLDEDEVKLNSILMSWKQEELDYTTKNPQYFNFSKSYFEYRKFFEASKVYQLIKRMPKGALLHIHSNAILGPDFFVKATYKNDLFVCFEKTIKLKYSNTVPEDPCEQKWESMKKVRDDSKNITRFDEQLRKNFTMIGTHDFNQPSLVWKRFAELFTVIFPILSYRPVWENYLYEALNVMRKDKIMYVEIRSSLVHLYEADGTVHDEFFFLNVTKRIVDHFVKDHPDFFGVKIIVAYNRHGFKPAESIEVVLNKTKIAKKMFPDFVIGFDLVAEEDLGSPLVKFLPQLEEARSEMDFFFHAGETNWYGTFVDENLVDAVVLGSRRIGHGLALLKHPRILKEVISKDIAVEVCVISNQILGYVHDERNHPLAIMLAENVPVTVNSDDPGLWEARPLSDDLYVSFVGVASAKYDLRLIKQLALNSLKYSALSNSEKGMASKMFNSQWRNFVRSAVKDSTVIQEISRVTNAGKAHKVKKVSG